jgi:hypothetical protein
MDTGSLPECRLFKAVITQTIADACIELGEMPPLPSPIPAAAKSIQKKNGKRILTDAEKRYNRKKGRHSKWHQDRRDRDQAREWLSTNTPDFRKVCEFAEFDPDYILRGVRKLIANNWQAPMKVAA